LLLVQNDDLRDLFLHLVERAQEHLARAHAVRLDVLVAHGLERLVDGDQLRQVVGRGLLARRGDGVRRLEALPEPAGPEPQREIGRQGEDAQNSYGSTETLEDTHGNDQYNVGFFFGRPGNARRGPSARARPAAAPPRASSARIRPSSRRITTLDETSVAQRFTGGHAPGRLASGGGCLDGRRIGDLDAGRALLVTFDGV